MSNDYWKKREEEAKRRAQKKQQEEYDKEIERIYKRTLAAINDQIASWYIKYAQKEGISMAEARKRVNDLDIEAFAQLADKYVSEHDLSEQANQDMAIYNLTMKINRLELLKAQIGFELCKSAQELEEFMKKELEGRSLEEVQRLAGILGQSVMDIKDRVLAIPNASFHNATFSDRIWSNQSLLKAELDKLLSVGIIRGTNPRELAKEIKTKLDTTTYNAERLMRTEMCRIQTEAARLSFEKMGFTQYEFIAGPSACGICQSVEKENDGIYDMDKMEIGVNAPPMHPNCMCSIAPYEDEDEYEAWLNGYKEHGMTFEDWRESDIRNSEIEKYRNSDEYIKNKKAEEEFNQHLLDRKSKSSNNEPSYPKSLVDQYGKYKSLLGDVVPKSIEQFKKLKYNNSSWWKKTKNMFRIVNQYECYTKEGIPNLIGKMNPRLIYKLHFDAFNTKKKFTGNAKSRANMAIMSIDGNIYYGNSQASRKEDAAYYNFKGDKSKLVLSPDKQTFDTLIIDHDRNVDSEYKLFEFAAKICDDGKPHKITILSQIHCCDSCEGVAEQFAKRYPNAEITLVSTKESRMQKAAEAKKSGKGNARYIDAWNAK